MHALWGNTVQLKLTDLLRPFTLKLAEHLPIGVLSRNSILKFRLECDSCPSRGGPGESGDEEWPSFRAIPYALLDEQQTGELGGPRARRSALRRSRRLAYRRWRASCSVPNEPGGLDDHRARLLSRSLFTSRKPCARALTARARVRLSLTGTAHVLRLRSLGARGRLPLRPPVTLASCSFPASSSSLPPSPPLPPPSLPLLGPLWPQNLHKSREETPFAQENPPYARDLRSPEPHSSVHLSFLISPIPLLSPEAPSIETTVRPKH